MASEMVSPEEFILTERLLGNLGVHRMRVVTGNDGNPLNEVKLICDALMNNKR
jgi:hypothetical protein